MVLRALFVICSAALTAAVFIFVWHFGGALPAITTAAAFGVTAPMAGVALAFPAVYLLWEQSEL